jgi:hypothetical protein
MVTCNKVVLETESIQSLELRVFKTHDIDLEELLKEIELDLKIKLLRKLIEDSPKCTYTDMRIERVPANRELVRNTLRSMYRDWDILPSTKIIKYGGEDVTVSDIWKKAIDDLITVRLTCTVVRDY